MTETRMCSRREALRTLLGAPLALTACKGRRSRPYPGRLLGASSNLGHRLRSDATLERASGPEIPLGVAIIGAGPSGLSAAWRLERLGYRDFSLFDLEPQAGGTSAYGTDGVVPHPWGAHYVPLPSAENPALVTLLSEMGALSVGADGSVSANERALVRAPEERLFHDGEWHEGLFPTAGATPADWADLRRFEAEVARWAAYRDTRGRRAFAVPMRLGSDAAEVTALDRMSAARFLDDLHVRSPRVRWYVEYACRDDYGLDLEHTSAWALLFYYCARSLTPNAPSQPFLTWPEGNGRLVSHLARVAGERMHLGQLVTDVLPEASGVRLSVFDVATQKLRIYRADRVIFAVPKFLLSRILRPFKEAPPAYLAEFQYGSWLVANLHLRARPKSRGFSFAWDNVLYDSPSLGYVVATHQTLADLGPTVWTYYLPLVGADPKRTRRELEALDHAACTDAIVSDLGRAHQGLEGAIERVDVWRWGHAMISPRPGFIWGGARARATMQLGERVFFAHSDSSGVALFEEAQDHGVRAAEAALRALGRDVPALTPG